MCGSHTNYILCYCKLNHPTATTRKQVNCPCTLSLILIIILVKALEGAIFLRVASWLDACFLKGLSFSTWVDHLALPRIRSRRLVWSSCLSSFCQGTTCPHNYPCFTFSSYLLKMSDRVGELAQWETENPTEFESSIVIKKARSG